MSKSLLSKTEAEDWERLCRIVGQRGPDTDPEAAAEAVNALMGILGESVLRVRTLEDLLLMKPETKEAIVKAGASAPMSVSLHLGMMGCLAYLTARCDGKDEVARRLPAVAIHIAHWVLGQYTPEILEPMLEGTIPSEIFDVLSGSKQALRIAGLDMMAEASLPAFLESVYELVPGQPTMSEGGKAVS